MEINKEENVADEEDIEIAALELDLEKIKKDISDLNGLKAKLELELQKLEDFEELLEDQQLEEKMETLSLLTKEAEEVKEELHQFLEEEEKEEESEEETVQLTLNTIAVNNKDWKKLAWISVKLKVICFLVCLIISIMIYILLIPFMETGFGLVSYITTSFSVNHFFLAMSLTRFLFYINCYFTMSPSLIHAEKICFFAYTSICWVTMSVCLCFIFPDLTGKNYSREGVEVAPSTQSKSLIFLSLFLSNFVSQSFAATTYFTFITYFKEDWLPTDMKERPEMRNVRNIFINSLKVEFVVALVFWFLFFLVISIGSLSLIPNLPSSVEIFIFGYFFPVIKAGVVAVCTLFINYLSRIQNWTPEYKRNQASIWCGLAILVCTLPQLYVVIRGSSDYSYFLSQYLPHEVIKKLSWLTFHPLYLKAKMQIMHALEKLFLSVCRKKDKVDPLGVKRPRRFTAVVMQGMDTVAGDILGRQLGEDFCMILITIMLLPISQQYLFPQLYPVSTSSSYSSSLPFPSYENIAVMVGIAYSLETVLTVLCFTILQRVNVPLASNATIFEFNAQLMLIYVFGIASLIMTLVATMVY